jgi:hypothetical protein
MDSYHDAIEAGGVNGAKLVGLTWEQIRRDLGASLIDARKVSMLVDRLKESILYTGGSTSSGTTGTRGGPKTMLSAQHTSDFLIASSRSNGSVSRPLSRDVRSPRAYTATTANSLYASKVGTGAAYEEFCKKRGFGDTRGVPRGFGRNINR